jgi:hypothetical protein
MKFVFPLKYCCWNLTKAGLRREMTVPCCAITNMGRSTHKRKIALFIFLENNNKGIKKILETVLNFKK